MRLAHMPQTITMTALGSPSSLPSGAALHALHGQTMGTSWCVKLVASPRVDLHALHNGVQSLLDGLVAQMSTWETDSEISRYNRLPAGAWQVLPEEFFEVLACALQVAAESGGAYDPTVGPLVDTWGFGPGGRNGEGLPAPAQLASARADVGWERIALLAQQRSALQPGGARLDLSAIAKGYAVDQVSAQLRGMGIAAALVEVGGELHGYGRKPDGEQWRILVETAPDQAEAQAEELPTRVIALDQLAAATSGDHWHVFEHEGQRHSHTLDPRTGAPVRHAPAAVTVIADSAMRADAWATALTVMGAAEGHAFAQARNLAARFVSRGPDGLVESMTDAFRAHLPA